MTAYPNDQSHVLIVTYNLKAGAGEYGSFYEKLKRQGSSWWHYLPSTWLIATSKSSQEVAADLRGEIYEGDHIFVGTLQDGFSGWLPKKAWDWLKKQGLESKS